MDALALLCNLHADGPATLQRLRRIGCQGIEALAKLDDQALALELRQDASAARRFKREAHNLMVRQQGGTPLPEPVQEELIPVEVIPVPKGKRAGMDHVLEAWRKLDEEACHGSEVREQAAERVLELGQADDLELAGVDGLTPALHKRLSELGIRTLCGLTETPSLKLAQDLPLPLTHVKRLQLMARRIRESPKQKASHTKAARDLQAPIQFGRPAVQAFERRAALGVDALEPESSTGREELQHLSMPPLQEIDVPRVPRQPPLPRPHAAQPAAGEKDQETPESGAPKGLRVPEEEEAADRSDGLDSDLERLDSAGPFA